MGPVRRISPARRAPRPAGDLLRPREQPGDAAVRPENTSSLGSRADAICFCCVSRLRFALRLPPRAAEKAAPPGSDRCRSSTPSACGRTSTGCGTARRERGRSPATERAPVVSHSSRTRHLPERGRALGEAQQALGLRRRPRADDQDRAPGRQHGTAETGRRRPTAGARVRQAVSEAPLYYMYGWLRWRGRCPASRARRA